MNDWQPIETAPKDGTWVLLRGGEQYDRTWYGKGDSEWPTAYVCAWDSECEGPCDDDGSFSSGSWVIGCVWDGDLRSGYENPTHWMPLLPPPKDENGTN